MFRFSLVSNIYIAVYRSKLYLKTYIIYALFMITWEWIAGFIDGEGCIKLIKQKVYHKKETSLKYQYTCLIQVCQNDIPLLQNICIFLRKNNVISYMMLSKKNNYSGQIRICRQQSVNIMIKNIAPYINNSKQKFFLNILDQASSLMINRKNINNVEYQKFMDNLINIQRTKQYRRLKTCGRPVKNKLIILETIL